VAVKNMQKRWEAYGASIAEYSKQSDYSHLWANMIQDFGSEYRGKQDFRKNFRDYGLNMDASMSGRTHEIFQLLVGGAAARFEELSTWLSRKPLSKLSYWAAQAQGGKVRRRDVYDERIFRVWSFMRSQGIDFDSHFDALANSKRPKLTFNTLKTVYFYDKILSNLGKEIRGPDVRFMEVGAGMGNLAILLAGTVSSFTYYVVDLPEMLMVLSTELAHHLPNAVQRLPNEVKSHAQIDAMEGNQRFVLLTPAQAGLIPDESIDLAINIESFAEMNQPTANGYVNEINRSLKVGGHFFTANRESRIIDSPNELPQITSHWKYPFEDSDKVVLWEYCPMRDYLTRQKTRNINRIGQKVKSLKVAGKRASGRG
jgi:SAM-dependent methyltransferase